MSVDEKSPEDYVTLDDPVCSAEDGCGGSGRIGQGLCPKCGGVGRRKGGKALDELMETPEPGTWGAGRRRRQE